MNTAQALKDYAIAALWTGLYYESEEDDSPSQLDSIVTLEDIPEDVMTSMREDVESFCAMLEAELTREDLAELTELIGNGLALGHDFLLTRNHHGAGFWDRGLGELGDTLTTLAESFGSQDLTGYRNADGSVTVIAGE